MYIGQGMLIAMAVGWVIYAWEDIKPQLIPCALTLIILAVGLTYYVTQPDSVAHFVQMWRDGEWNRANWR